MEREKAEQAWGLLQIQIFSDQANSGSEALPGQKGVSSPILDPKEDLNSISSIFCMSAAEWGKTQVSSSEHQVLVSSSPRYLLHEHFAALLLFYNSMCKHICSLQMLALVVSSLQERKNLLDFLHVVHFPQGFCESGAAIIPNAVVVQAGNNTPRKMGIELLLLSIPSQARGELQSHTYSSLFRDGISQSASTSSGMAALLSFM